MKLRLYQEGDRTHSTPFPHCTIFISNWLEGQELRALDEFRNLFLANDPETLAMVAQVKMLVAQQSARENYGATVDA